MTAGVQEGERTDLREMGGARTAGTGGSSWIVVEFYERFLCALFE